MYGRFPSNGSAVMAHLTFSLHFEVVRREGWLPFSGEMARAAAIGRFDVERRFAGKGRVVMTCNTGISDLVVIYETGTVSNSPGCRT